MVQLYYIVSNYALRRKIKVTVLRNRKLTKRLLLFTGLILVTVSFVLLALVFLLRYEWMWTWWKTYQQFLKNLENQIFSIKNHLLFC